VVEVTLAAAAWTTTPTNALDGARVPSPEYAAVTTWPPTEALDSRPGAVAEPGGQRHRSRGIGPIPAEYNVARGRRRPRSRA